MISGLNKRFFFSYELLCTNKKYIYEITTFFFSASRIVFIPFLGWFRIRKIIFTSTTERRYFSRMKFTETVICVLKERENIPTFVNIPILRKKYSFFYDSKFIASVRIIISRANRPGSTSYRYQKQFHLEIQKLMTADNNNEFFGFFWKTRFLCRIKYKKISFSFENVSESHFKVLLF